MNRENNLGDSEVNKNMPLSNEADNDSEQNEYVLNAAYKILEILANDPLLALLTDLKIKEQTNHASSEDMELLNAIENHLDKFIKGEAMHNEEAKKEIEEVNSQSPEEHINNMVGQVANLFFETHTPKEGYESLKDFLLSPDREKHINEALGSLGEGAQDIEVLKAALTKFKPQKVERANEEDNVGKMLNPSSKPKPKKKSVDISKMSPREYQEYISKVLEENS